MPLFQSGEGGSGFLKGSLHVFKGLLLRSDRYSDIIVGVIIIVKRVRSVHM